MPDLNFHLKSLGIDPKPLDREGVETLLKMALESANMLHRCMISIELHGAATRAELPREVIYACSQLQMAALHARDEIYFMIGKGKTPTPCIDPTGESYFTHRKE